MFPKDLGSKATDTPVPKIPFEETPTHPDKKKVINNNIKILNFIFYFKTKIINFFFLEQHYFEKLNLQFL